VHQNQVISQTKRNLAQPQQTLYIYTELQVF